MKIGCHVLQWGIAIDKDTRYTWDGRIWKTSLQQVLGEIAEMNYEGFDCSDNDIIPYFDRRQEFRAMVLEDKLSFVSCWVSLIPKTATFTQNNTFDPNRPQSDPLQYASLAIDEINPEAISKDYKAKVEFAKNFAGLGGQLITLGGPFIFASSVRDEHYRIIGEYVNDLAEEFKKLDLECVYHPHLMTLVQNSCDIDKLYEYADKDLVGLLLDTAHLAAVGEEPADIVRKYSSRILHCHFKDLGKGKFLELGQGKIDFKAIVKALIDINYRRWIIAELDVPSRSATESAKMNKEFLDGLVMKFGR